MGLSNYPPGVTGNEPQISGIWPVETVVDEAVNDIDRVKRILDEALTDLDDQGLFHKQLQKVAEETEDQLQALRDEINALIREE